MSSAEQGICGDSTSEITEKVEEPPQAGAPAAPATSVDDVQSSVPE